MATILTGSFVSTGTQFNLAIRSGYDMFQMVNITDSSTATLQAAANSNVMRAWGSSLMAPGTAFRNLKTNGSPSLVLEGMIATAGFTFFDAGNPPTFAQFPVTGVTAASPAVITTTGAPGFVVGDTIRLTSLNGTMQPMSGLLYTIDAVGGANTFTITFDASNGGIGGTPATAGFAQKVIPSYFSPHNVVVGPTAVVSTAGGQLLLNLNTVPSLSQAPSQYSPFLRPYQPGAYLRVDLPSGFGMTFGSSPSSVGLLTQIVQFNTQAGYATPNQVQLQIVTQGNPLTAPQDAFALAALVYPTGAANYHGQVPLVTDIGETVPNLSEAEDNTGILGITIGTGVQTTGKLYQWFARKGYII